MYFENPVGDIQELNIDVLPKLNRCTTNKGFPFSLKRPNQALKGKHLIGNNQILRTQN